MSIWKEFRQFCAENLNNDLSLKALDERATTDDDAFWSLATTIHARIMTWWNGRIAPRYYEETDLMTRYEETQALTVPGRERLFDLALDALAPLRGKHVLELCTGAGAGAIRLASGGADVIASDGSQVMLDLNAETLRQRGIRVLPRAEQGNLDGTAWSNLATYRPELGESFLGFDGILIFMGIHFVRDRARAYEGIRSLLIPGGTVVVVHDHLRPGYVLTTSPTNVRDTVTALKANGRTKTTLTTVIAGIVMRRSIMHREHPITLDEERTIIQQTFGNHRYTHDQTYPEWAVLSAKRI